MPSAVVPERDGTSQSSYFRSTLHLNPPQWVEFGARACERNNLNNVRKTLILAAITGTLVSVPSATATAEPMSFDTNVAPAAPAPDAPPPPPAPTHRRRRLRTHRRRRHRTPRRLPRWALTRTFPRRRTLLRPTPPPRSGRTASTGTPSRSASRAETGGSAPVTASPVVCSSPPALGTPTAARVLRTAPAVRSRSGWPRMCCTRRASVRGRSAAVAADR